MTLDGYVLVLEPESPDTYNLNTCLSEHKHPSLIHCLKTTCAAAAPNRSTLQPALKGNR